MNARRTILQAGERGLVALHEAAHAVIAVQLGGRVDGITLRENGTGCVDFRAPLPPAPGAPNRVGAVVCYAGALAVERFTGSPQHCPDDLALAAEFARGKFLVQYREQAREAVERHFEEIVRVAAELLDKGSVTTPGREFLRLREQMRVGLRSSTR